MCAERFRTAGIDGRQRGLTLIELIVFIIVVSVGIAGILSVINVVVTSSADPMVRKQAVSMAEAILEEVLTKDYAPNAGYPHPAAATCPARVLADDVDDYANCNGAAFIAGNTTLGAASIAALAGYAARVTVEAPEVSEVTMKRITVTVTDTSGQSFALTGYKASY